MSDPTLMHSLDDIDLQILAALQAEGRLTNVALAARVGLSAPRSCRRLKTLEGAGLVLGYHAVLDAARLDFGTAAYLFVGLKSQSTIDTEEFERALSLWSLVRECHALNGETDYLLKCVARSAKEVQSFVTDTLLRTQNVKTVKTAFVVRAVKVLPGVPLLP